MRFEGRVCTVLEEIDEDQARARTCTPLLLRLAYYLPLSTEH